MQIGAGMICPTATRNRSRQCSAKALSVEWGTGLGASERNIKPVAALWSATEGTIKVTTDWWPRPGTDKPLEKTSFYTKAGDQICGVGYYK